MAGVVAALERRGCAVTVCHTGPAAGDAERLARGAEPAFDVIVAAGGDGTINAVVNGIAGTGRALAVLPIGSANVLAHEIGLRRRPDELAALIAGGTACPIWPGEAGGRLFVTMASAGFDAAVVAAVRPGLKRAVGRLAFASAIAAQWCRREWPGLIVRIDEVEHAAATVIAAKARCYAGPFVVAPQAGLTAPVLNFVLFRRSGRLAVLRYLTALLRGRLHGRRDVAVIAAREALVTATDRIPVQADGEIVGQLPVRISIADRPLFLIMSPRVERV